MPPKKIVEYIVFIVDCKFSIDKKLDQLYRIYVTKCFQQTKSSSDMHRIVLINTPINNTVEPLTEWSYYQLGKLKGIKNEITGNGCLEEPPNPNNFLKGVEYAIKTFEEIGDKNILMKKIVVLTDLLTPLSNNIDKIKRTRTNLKKNDVILYIIGVDIADIPKLKTHKDVKNLFNLEYLSNVRPFNSEQKENLDIIRKLSQDNVLILKYEHAQDLLFSYKPKTKKPYPWYVNLTIGTDLRIPVHCYRTTRLHPRVKTYPAPLTKGFNYIKMEKAWFDLNTHEEVPPEDVVKGYSYHNKFVSFTPEQRENMKIKKKFNKCLSIVAFLDANEIPTNLYVLPDSIAMVNPDMRSVRSNAKGFKLFVAGLREKNVVALAKRVYNNGFNANMFVIFPCPKHKKDSHLLMAQLPYANQFKEKFYRGKNYEVEDTDSVLKEYTYNFLDAMSADCYKNGQPIFPLPESLKSNVNRARQYKFIAKKFVNEDPGESPVLEPNPYLSECSAHFGDFLHDYLNETKDE